MLLTACFLVFVCEQDAVVLEQRQNEEEVAKSLGDEVPYGSVIQVWTRSCWPQRTTEPCGAFGVSFSFAGKGNAQKKEEPFAVCHLYSVFCGLRVLALL